MKRIQWVILVLILLGAFFVRLYKFNGTIADWHSWRQADTSAVSRNYVNAGKINFLYPRFDDLSNVPSGLDNPQGYRFVEFPIYNIFQAGGYMLFHRFTIEEWGRLVTIFSSIGAITFLFLLTKKYSDGVSGIFSAFFYAFLPFDIFYGRTILPDQSMIATTLGGIYFFDLWSEKSFPKWKRFFLLMLSIIFSATALLLKPFAIFFFLPMLCIALYRFKLRMFLKPSLWIFAILSTVPLVLWRLWIQQYPAGIPQSSWLFNSGNIRFTGAYFHWIFARRIAELIAGYWGVVLLGLGIVIKKRNNLFFLSFLASSLIYVIVVARGNVQHSYYQIPIMPSIAIFMGFGSGFLIKPPKEYISKVAGWIVLIVCILFALGFSWFEVRDYYTIQHPEIMIAGQAVDTLTPKNAKIIAPYDGDTSFLYQTKRKGWASFEKDLQTMIKMGADYLVLLNTKPEDYNIGKTYKIVSVTKDYILFDLH